MQIATQHSEAVRERSGRSVKERLLLDGIALHSGNVTERNVELAAAIEAYFADSRLPFLNRTAMTARKAANAAVAARSGIDGLPKRAIADAHAPIENLAQRGHTSIVRLMRARWNYVASDV